MNEADVIINGVRLTEAQAMTLRVAISGFLPACGDDDHGRFMSAAYRKAKLEIFNLMIHTSTKTSDIAETAKLRKERCYHGVHALNHCNKCD